MKEREKRGLVELKREKSGENKNKQVYTFHVNE